MSLFGKIFGSRRPVHTPGLIDEIDRFISLSITHSAGFDLKPILGPDQRSQQYARLRCAIYYIWCARRAMFSIAQGHPQESVLCVLGDHLGFEFAIDLGERIGVSQDEILAAFAAFDQAVANDA